MKVNSLIKWTLKGKKAFHQIKEAMANTAALVCPDYIKYFIMYSYALDHTYLAILMQKNHEGVESPIAFMSYSLKAHELKYSKMEKHAFSMVKPVKHFRFYILNSHVIALVPDVVVKSIWMQQEFGTKRGNWVAKIKEYDMEIKPNKLVRGKGLCQLIADNKSIDEVVLENEGMNQDLPKVLIVNTTDEWYFDLAYLLTYGDYLAHQSHNERQTLKLKVVNFVLWDNGLYKKGLDDNFLHCVDKQQQVTLLQAFHDIACGGHFSAPVIAHKIFHARYYWPILFKDTCSWVHKCQQCQQFLGKPKLAAPPLKLVVIEEPFQQWGLDFIGPVNPTSSASHIYILIATGYFTKWVEAIPTKQATSAVVYPFLKENIVSRFDVPHKIVTDNASCFSSYEIIDFFFDHGITLSPSFDYYPKGNGQVESSNKNLVTIMRKLVDERQQTWHKSLYDALWADCITPKSAIDMSPFQLLYGSNAKIPITMELLALKLAKAIEDETYQDSLDKRIVFLSQLEETRA